MIVAIKPEPKACCAVCFKIGPHRFGWMMAGSKNERVKVKPVPLCDEHAKERSRGAEASP